MIVFPLTALGTNTSLEEGAGLQSRIRLPIQRENRRFVQTEFILDTGASLSMMGLEQAEQLGLRVPGTSREVKMMTSAGERKQKGRFGLLVVRFDEVPHRLFAWNCWFLEGWPTNLVPLLGLGGRVLRDLEITFKGASPAYPLGSVWLDIVSPGPPPAGIPAT